MRAAVHAALGRDEQARGGLSAPRPPAVLDQRRARAGQAHARRLGPARGRLGRLEVGAVVQRHLRLLKGRGSGLELSLTVAVAVAVDVAVAVAVALTLALVLR